MAARVLADQPEQAAQALTAIKAASKEGLRELRGILNVLRQADEPESTTPAPRLDQLDALVATTTEAGLPTTVTVSGVPCPPPPTVDLRAYRIIQESLTNALRYAEPTFLTTFESDEHVYAALEAGASGFLVKDTEPVELLQAVRVVARGDALLSPSVTRRLIEDVLAPGRLPSTTTGTLSVLTAREREVLALVGTGPSNDDEIAGRLYLSPLTAKTHVSRAMTKLGARDRVQLVVLAYSSGLVAPGQ